MPQGLNDRWMIVCEECAVFQTLDNDDDLADHSTDFDADFEYGHLFGAAATEFAVNLSDDGENLAVATDTENLADILL